MTELGDFMAYLPTGYDSAHIEDNTATGFRDYFGYEGRQAVRM